MAWAVGVVGLCEWRVVRPFSYTPLERRSFLPWRGSRFSLVSSGGELVLGSGISGLGLLLGVALVKLHELGEIELGLLEDLDLLDEHVLEREDLGALLRDLLGNVLGEAKLIY